MQKTIRLKRGAGQRAAGGHLWIFANELDLCDAPLDNGDDVVVEDSRGRLIGSGFYSAHSLISVRLHSSGERKPLTEEEIAERLKRAFALRKALLGDGDVSCRLVFGEADGLPGIVADRYGEYLSVQLLNAGTELRKDQLAGLLAGLTGASGIVLRNDSPSREHEGLSRYVETVSGEVPGRVRFPYQGFTLAADLHGGQKTGFFFDQRENYRLLEAVSPGARVLDTFCYSGAWGLSALRAGAAGVTFLDISEGALELARENAMRNGLEEKASYLCRDALDYLKSAPEPFDAVVLDPPAFVKSRKKLAEALRGYLNLNKWGLRAVKSGGYLVTCSCSHHVSPGEFVDMVALAAREAGRKVRVLGAGRQGPDHPWIPAMPETDYLKVLLLSVD